MDTQVPKILNENDKPGYKDFKSNPLRVVLFVILNMWIFSCIGMWVMHTTGAKECREDLRTKDEMIAKKDSFIQSLIRVNEEAKFERDAYRKITEEGPRSADSTLFKKLSELKK